jgi:hypothetical protein
MRIVAGHEPTLHLTCGLPGSGKTTLARRLAIERVTGIVLDAAAPENRVAMTSTLIIAALVGLSIPVIGAGVSLSRGVSAADTVLVFGIAVALGVAFSGWALLGRRTG